jgi:predicted nucleic acid-binding protein
MDQGVGTSVTLVLREIEAHLPTGDGDEPRKAWLELMLPFPLEAEALVPGNSPTGVLDIQHGHGLLVHSPEVNGRARAGFLACSVRGVTRFVVDCETLLRIATGEIGVAPEHKLFAPTLVRSQALSALYEAARRGEISAAEGIERVTRINSLKVRFLGDKVLQRTAWKVADQLGWGTTFDAEFVALTQLQADVFVTSDSELARAVDGLVKTATIDALRTV